MKDFVGEYTVADNYHDIYVNNLKKHWNEYLFINSPRGFVQKERVFTSFTLLNPIERVCYTQERKPNIIFMFAEVLWYLKGDNSLDFISYYSPSMKKYSMDGETLSGSAYGPKIFNWQNSINQWESVYKELLYDSESKRAVIHIRNPDEMLITNNTDATCTLTFQFLNREGRLLMVTSMRANDMYKGALSDIFSFTFLQELMSNQLNLKIGPYHHQVASSHIYEPDYNQINNVIEHSKPRAEYKYNFPKMPLGNNWDCIRTIILLEERLRKNILKLSTRDIEITDLPDYWKQVLNLFEIKRQVYYERAISQESYTYLFPIYKYFIANQYDQYLRGDLQIMDENTTF